MNAPPFAYHITFGTYGTRLHGDERGTVDRSMNEPGDPIVGADRAWWELERNKLKFEPVVLTAEQMRFAESVMPVICRRGGWDFRTGAGGPDRIHVVLGADAWGDAVRKWFKRWLGEAMSETWGRPPGATWWAEGWSVKWVWTGAYYGRVFGYVNRQRASGPLVRNSNGDQCLSRRGRSRAVPARSDRRSEPWVNARMAQRPRNCGANRTDTVPYANGA